MLSYRGERIHHYWREIIVESWIGIPVEARRLLATLTLGTLLSTGCAVQDRSVSTGADLRKLPEEEPRVVDCLLPSQVRHLGTQLTYLSPRQAIKTSARDCEIRGGSQQGPSATSSLSN
jgi:hypothetical protein